MEFDSNKIGADLNVYDSTRKGDKGRRRRKALEEEKQKENLEKSRRQNTDEELSDEVRGLLITKTKKTTKGISKGESFIGLVKNAGETKEISSDDAKEKLGTARIALETLPDPKEKAEAVTGEDIKKGVKEIIVKPRKSIKISKIQEVSEISNDALKQKLFNLGLTENDKFLVDKDEEAGGYKIYKIENGQRIRIGEYVDSKSGGIGAEAKEPGTPKEKTDGTITGEETDRTVDGVLKDTGGEQKEKKAHKQCSILYSHIRKSLTPYQVHNGGIDSEVKSEAEKLADEAEGVLKGESPDHAQKYETWQEKLKAFKNLNKKILEFIERVKKEKKDSDIRKTIESEQNVKFSPEELEAIEDYGEIAEKIISHINNLDYVGKYGYREVAVRFLRITEKTRHWDWTRKQMLEDPRFTGNKEEKEKRIEAAIKKIQKN